MMAMFQAEALSTKELQDRINSGKLDTKTLLRHAVPYKQGLRRAQNNQQYYGNNNENNNENNGYAGYNNAGYNGQNGYSAAQDSAFQFDGEEYGRIDATPDYKVIFNSCVNLETENYKLMSDNLASYAKEGTLKSLRSYVLFNVCNGNWCRNTDSTLYMIDLVSFVQAALSYGPDEKQRVCNACKANAEICGRNTGYTAQKSNYANKNDNNYNNQATKYAIFDQNTCAKCDEFDCW